MKNYKKLIFVTVFISIFVSASVVVSAHPGRTDSRGGHFCRTNCASWGLKIGEYHFHNGDSSSAPSTATPKPSVSTQPTIDSTAKPQAVQQKPLDVAQQVIDLPVPKVAERIQNLRANNLAPVLWADIILEETKNRQTSALTKTVDPSKEAVKRITDANQAELIQGDTKLYFVKSVSDGDTIKVVMDGKIQTVRLLGIDTPETKDPRKPVQCFGREATNHMRSLALGKYIKLESDPTQGDRDKYNRLLRYAYLSDGTNLNSEMVKNGYASAYVRFPVQQLDQYIQLQQYARDNNLGLWSACR